MKKIVIGLGFGDEGKGLVVDWLASQNKNSIVVRFSGGHQVGHTVFTDETNHIFSNFGSGTLRGIPTYWSRFCTVEPIGLLTELKILKDKNINPILYIDENCPITTPYDINHNHNFESINKHGSCGVGFGATIEREEKFYSLKFLDLFHSKIFNNKLESIRNYYHTPNIDIESFIACCKILINPTCMESKIELKKFIPRSDNFIFEGSQGLLLDKNIGFFPNVTRANTSTENILELIKEEQALWFHGGFEEEIYLVTRAYQTRHGNGFMTNEDIPHNIIENENETNKDNKYQGKFRKSLLDLSLLKYGLNKEIYINTHYNKTLVITCLDQVVNDYRFTYNDEIVCCLDEDDFVTKISNILNIKKVYISRTNNSKNIVRFK